MSAVVWDSFDLYNGTGTNTGLQSMWALIGSTATLVAGRFGGQAVSAQGGGFTRTLPSTYSSYSYGVALKVTVAQSANTAHGWCAQLSSGTYQVGFTVLSTGAVAAYRLTGIAAGTLLGQSADGVIITGQWHFVEVEMVISDTVGVFNVYVDNVSVLSLSGQDTRNGAPTTINQTTVGDGNGTTTRGTKLFDDFYFEGSGTRLGERRVEVLYPTSDVAQGFARSTGATNYTLVDEAQVNGDTDYVQGTSIGDVDTYGFADLSNSPTTINGVQFVAFAEKTDATARSIALQAVSGVTTSDGGNFSLAAAYGRFERPMITDPNTSAAWGTAGVNAVKGGPKVTV